MCALSRAIVWQEMKSTEAIIPEMTKAYEPHMKTYGWWGRKVCDQLRVRAWPWTPQSREPSIPDYLFRNSWKWCFEEGSQILLDIGPEPPSQRRNAANYGRSWFFNNRSRTWTSIFLDVSSSRRVGAPFAWLRAYLRSPWCFRWIQNFLGQFDLVLSPGEFFGN